MICFSFHSKENEQIKAIKTDIDATKKEILKQMEQNENLEQFQQRIINDLNHLNMQCQFSYKFLILILEFQ